MNIRAWPRLEARGRVIFDEAGNRVAEIVLPGRSIDMEIAVAKIMVHCVRRVFENAAAEVTIQNLNPHKK